MLPRQMTSDRNVLNLVIQKPDYNQTATSVLSPVRVTGRDSFADFKNP